MKEIVSTMKDIEICEPMITIKSTMKPEDVIKDPYILEFLGFPELSKYSESDLEEKIISNLENFLLELGKGFTFVKRQFRITYDEEHFKVDLVFYNRILRCFVLFDTSRCAHSLIHL